MRSPLKCIAPKGTCAKCFGIDEHGQLPAIGENIGVKTGQAMSEPLTQFVMRTFHSGGLAGDASAGGFNRVTQLLKMPEYVAGEAALAKTPGKVSKITKLDTGGHVIHIGDETHTVAPGRALKVKPGDQVQAGDALSAGVLKPQLLYKLKGMPAAQEYVVDELQKAYQGQGIPMQRRIFETVVRSTGNLTRVVNAPKHGDFKEGEVVPYTTAEHYNETRATELPVHETAGYHLQQPHGKLPKFHEVTDKDIPYLKGLGYNQVKVLKDPLIHAPILKGIEQLPLEKKNWMAQLGYRYIQNTLTKGSAEAWKSSIAGNHPIPAFAYGVSFGQKKEHY